MKKQKMNKRFWWTFLCTLILLGLCLLHALEARHYMNFVATNGDFQNFNPVRRLLSGQIPYRDFQDYLGLGHLYFGTLFTWLFGGNFAASKMAFTLLMILVPVLLAVILGRAIGGKDFPALETTIFLLVCLLLRPAFFSNAGILLEEFAAALANALSSGNSVRFVRGGVLVVFVGGLWGAFLLLEKYLPDTVPESRRRLIRHAIVAFFSGMALVWSNDYGISCWLCATIMLTFVACAKRGGVKKTVFCLLFQIGFSLLSALLVLQLLTWGHAAQWLQSTFGIGGAQSWYYPVDTRSFYVYQLDLSFVMALQGFVCLAYLVLLWRSIQRPDACRRYGLPAFLNMTGFCAVQEYKLLSGGNSREMALTILFLTIVFEALHFVGPLAAGLKNGTAAMRAAVTVTAGALLLSMARNELVFAVFTEKDGTYFEKLGGYMTEADEDILQAAEFLNGEPVFSTYATALEVVTDQFQPTGVDYIIHAMGDKAREKYLQTFLEGKYRYVTTINKTYTWYEDWIERANWWFYKEVFGNYHEVFSNSYQTFWERNGEDETTKIHIDGGVVGIYPVDDTTVKLTITLDEKVCGIADVMLDYTVQPAPRIRSLLQFNRMLEVQTKHKEDLRKTFTLPAEGQRSVPFYILDGYGEMVLNSLPGDGTLLTVNGASFDTVYLLSREFLDERQPS